MILGLVLQRLWFRKRVYNFNQYFILCEMTWDNVQNLLLLLLLELHRSIRWT